MITIKEACKTPCLQAVTAETRSSFPSPADWREREGPVTPKPRSGKGGREGEGFSQSFRLFILRKMESAGQSLTPALSQHTLGEGARRAASLGQTPEHFA